MGQAIGFTIIILLVTALLWFIVGGADWILWQVAGIVRGAIRNMKTDDAAETWAKRFENAAFEGLRDRDARKQKRS